MKISWGETAGTSRAGVSIGRFILPSLQDVLFLALFAAVIVLGPRLFNVDGDLGRHLTLGGYILDSGSIPARDLFSHTLYGAALTPHEWLAAVLYAGAYRIAGLNGVVLVCALLISVTFTLVYRQCLQRSGQALVSLGITLLAAAAASLHWLARPHLFTLLLVVLWAEVLERLRTGRSARWWLLPLLMLVWVNLHGAFLAGFALWAMVLAGELLEGGAQTKAKERGARVRLILAGGAAALVVSLANPAGWRLWETSLGFLGSSYLVGHTAEYFPPNFHLKSAWPFLGMIVLSLLLLGSSHKRLPLAHLLPVAGWTAMALVSARNIPLYAVLTAPALAGAYLYSIGPDEPASRFTRRFNRFQERLRRVEEGLSGHLWPGIVVIALSVILTTSVNMDSPGQRNRFDSQVFPVAAVDWLETQPPLGPVFNYFPWGGYLLYRLWPEQRVFIDGQTDFYGETLTRQYEQVITLQPGWEQILTRYHVDWVIMPPDSDLVGALRSGSGWQVLYRDETAAILSKGR